MSWWNRHDINILTGSECIYEKNQVILQIVLDVLDLKQMALFTDSSLNQQPFNVTDRFHQVAHIIRFWDSKDIEHKGYHVQRSHLSTQTIIDRYQLQLEQAVCQPDFNQQCLLGTDSS